MTAPLQWAAFALAGLLLGGASFAALCVSMTLYVTDEVWRPLTAHFSRLALMAAGLTVAARQGAGPLLAIGGGLVVARWIAVRLWGGAA